MANSLKTGRGKFGKNAQRKVSKLSNQSMLALSELESLANELSDHDIKSKDAKAKDGLSSKAKDGLSSASDLTSPNSSAVATADKHSASSITDKHSASDKFALDNAASSFPSQAHDIDSTASNARVDTDVGLTHVACVETNVGAAHIAAIDNKDSVEANITHASEGTNTTTDLTLETSASQDEKTVKVEQSASHLSRVNHPTSASSQNSLELAAHKAAILDATHSSSLPAAEHSAQVSTSKIVSQGTTSVLGQAREQALAENQVQGKEQVQGTADLDSVHAHTGSTQNKKRSAVGAVDNAVEVEGDKLSANKSALQQVATHTVHQALTEVVRGVSSEDADTDCSDKYSLDKEQADKRYSDKESLDKGLSDKDRANKDFTAQTSHLPLEQALGAGAEKASLGKTGLDDTGLAKAGLGKVGLGEAGLAKDSLAQDDFTSALSGVAEVDALIAAEENTTVSSQHESASQFGAKKLRLEAEHIMHKTDQGHLSSDSEDGLLHHISGKTFDLTELVPEIKLLSKIEQDRTNQDFLSGFNGKLTQLLNHRRLERMGASEFGVISIDSIKELIAKCQGELTENNINRLHSLFSDLPNKADLSRTLRKNPSMQRLDGFNFDNPCSLLHASLSDLCFIPGIPDHGLMQMRDLVQKACLTHEEHLFNAIKRYKFDPTTQSYQELVFYYYILALRTEEQKYFNLYCKLVDLQNLYTLFKILAGSFVSYEDFALVISEGRAGLEQVETYSHPRHATKDFHLFHFIYLLEPLKKCLMDMAPFFLSWLDTLISIDCKEIKHRYFSEGLPFEFNFVPPLRSYFLGLITSEQGQEALQSVEHAQADPERRPMMYYEILCNADQHKMETIPEYKDALKDVGTVLQVALKNNEFTPQMYEWVLHLRHQSDIFSALDLLDTNEMSLFLTNDLNFVSQLTQRLYYEQLAFSSKYRINLQRKKKFVQDITAYHINLLYQGRYKEALDSPYLKEACAAFRAILAQRRESEVALQDAYAQSSSFNLSRQQKSPVTYDDQDVQLQQRTIEPRNTTLLSSMQSLQEDGAQSGKNSQGLEGGVDKKAKVAFAGKTGADFDVNAGAVFDGKTGAGFVDSAMLEVQHDGSTRRQDSCIDEIELNQIHNLVLTADEKRKLRNLIKHGFECLYRQHLSSNQYMDLERGLYIGDYGLIPVVPGVSAHTAFLIGRALHYGDFGLRNEQISRTAYSYANLAGHYLASMFTANLDYALFSPTYNKQGELYAAFLMRAVFAGDLTAYSELCLYGRKYQYERDATSMSEEQPFLATKVKLPSEFERKLPFAFTLNEGLYAEDGNFGGPVGEGGLQQVTGFDFKAEFLKGDADALKLHNMFQRTGLGGCTDPESQQLHRVMHLFRNKTMLFTQHEYSDTFYQAIARNSEEYCRLFKHINPAFGIRASDEGEALEPSNQYHAVLSNAIIYIMDLVFEQPKLLDKYCAVLYCMVNQLYNIMLRTASPEGCLAVFKVLTTASMMESIFSGQNFNRFFENSRLSRMIYVQLLDLPLQSHTFDEQLNGIPEAQDIANIFLQLGMLQPHLREQGYNLLDRAFKSPYGNFYPCRSPNLDELVKTSAALHNGNSLGYLTSINKQTKHYEQSELYALVGSTVQSINTYRDVVRYCIKHDLYQLRLEQARSMLLLRQPYGYYEMYLCLKDLPETVAEAHTYLYYAVCLNVAEARHDYQELKAHKLFKPLPFLVYYLYLKQLAPQSLSALLCSMLLTIDNALVPSSFIEFLKMVEVFQGTFSNAQLKFMLYTYGILDPYRSARLSDFNKFLNLFPEEPEAIQTSSEAINGNFAELLKLSSLRECLIKNLDSDSFSAEACDAQVRVLLTKMFDKLKAGKTMLESLVLINWVRAQSFPEFLQEQRMSILETPFVIDADIDIAALEMLSSWVSFDKDIHNFRIDSEWCLALPLDNTRAREIETVCENIWSRVYLGQSRALMQAGALMALRSVFGRPYPRMFRAMCRYLGNSGCLEARRFVQLDFSYMSDAPYGDAFEYCVGQPRRTLIRHLAQQQSGSNLMSTQDQATEQCKQYLKLHKNAYVIDLLHRSDLAHNLDPHNTLVMPEVHADPLDHMLNDAVSLEDEESKQKDLELGAPGTWISPNLQGTNELLNYAYFMRLHSHCGVIANIVCMRNGWLLGHRANGPLRSYSSYLAKALLRNEPGAFYRYVYYVQSHYFKYRLNELLVSEDERTAEARKFVNNVLQLNFEDSKFHKFMDGMRKEGVSDFDSLLYSADNGYIQGRFHVIYPDGEYELMSGWRDLFFEDSAYLNLSVEQAIAARESLKHLAYKIDLLSDVASGRCTEADFEQAELESAGEFTVGQAAHNNAENNAESNADNNAKKNSEKNAESSAESGLSRSDAGKGQCDNAVDAVNPQSPSDIEKREQAGHGGLGQSDVEGKAQSLQGQTTQGVAFKGEFVDSVSSKGKVVTNAASKSKDVTSATSKREDVTSATVQSAAKSTERSRKTPWLSAGSQEQAGSINAAYYASSLDSSSGVGGARGELNRVNGVTAVSRVLLQHPELSRFLGQDASRLKDSTLSKHWINYTFYPESGSNGEHDLLQMLPYSNSMLDDCIRSNVGGNMQHSGHDLLEKEESGLVYEPRLVQWRCSKFRIKQEESFDAHKVTADQVLQNFNHSYDNAFYQINRAQLHMMRKAPVAHGSLNATIEAQATWAAMEHKRQDLKESEPKHTGSSFTQSLDGMLTPNALVTEEGYDSMLEKHLLQAYLNHTQVRDDVFYISEQSYYQELLHRVVSAVEKDPQLMRQGGALSAILDLHPDFVLEGSAENMHFETTVSEVGEQGAKLSPELSMKLSLQGRLVADFPHDVPRNFDNSAIYLQQLNTLVDQVVQDKKASSSQEPVSDRSAQHNLVSEHGEQKLASEHKAAHNQAAHSQPKRLDTEYAEQTHHKMFLHDELLSENVDNSNFADLNEAKLQAHFADTNAGSTFNAGESSAAADSLKQLVKEAAVRAGDGSKALVDAVINESRDNEARLLTHLQSFLSDKMGNVVPQFEGVIKTAQEKQIRDELDASNNEVAVGLSRIWEFDESLERQFTRPAMFHEDENPLHTFIYTVMTLMLGEETLPEQVKFASLILSRMHSRSGYFFGACDVIDSCFMPLILEVFKRRYYREVVRNQLFEEITKICYRQLRSMMESYGCGEQCPEEDELEQHLPKKFLKHVGLPSSLTLQDFHIINNPMICNTLMQFDPHVRALGAATREQVKEHPELLMDDSFINQALYNFMCDPDLLDYSRMIQGDTYTPIVQALHQVIDKLHKSKDYNNSTLPPLPLQRAECKVDLSMYHYPFTDAPLHLDSNWYDEVTSYMNKYCPNYFMLKEGNPMEYQLDNVKYFTPFEQNYKEVYVAERQNKVPRQQRAKRVIEIKHDFDLNAPLPYDLFEMDEDDDDLNYGVYFDMPIPEHIEDYESSDEAEDLNDVYMDFDEQKFADFADVVGMTPQEFLEMHLKELENSEDDLWMDEADKNDDDADDVDTDANNNEDDDEKVVTKPSSYKSSSRSKVKASDTRNQEQARKANAKAKGSTAQNSHSSRGRSSLDNQKGKRK